LHPPPPGSKGKKKKPSYVPVYVEVKVRNCVNKP